MLNCEYVRLRIHRHSYFRYPTKPQVADVENLFKFTPVPVPLILLVSHYLVESFN